MPAATTWILLPETSTCYNQEPWRRRAPKIHIPQVCIVPVSTGTCSEKPSLIDRVAEARALRRFPRSTSDGELSLARPDPAPLTKGMIERQPSSQNRRRQSTRDQKTPQGLGSIQNSPSKRYVSNVRNFSSFFLSSEHMT